MKRLLCIAIALAGCTSDKKICNEPPIYEALPSSEMRNPATGQCQSFSDAPPCDPQCGQVCPDFTGALPDWGTCYGACANLTESACLASTTCHAAYSVSPGPGATFAGCWDLPPSGALTGSCSGLDAQTCSEHPDCVTQLSAQLAPGYAGCAAKTMPVACSTLTTEAACKARPDCDPIYIGMNCTCDASGCTCESETYDHCQ